MNATKKMLYSLSLKNVQAVYSGKVGCACGCRGNYRYNSSMVKQASEDRGYAVNPDEVNDRQIRKVIRTLQELSFAVEFTPFVSNERLAGCLEIDLNNGKVYRAYVLREKAR